MAVQWIRRLRRGRARKDYDPRGPHFLSYRQSDGTELTDELMWRLRAAGVPVWRDKSDLLPGRTNDRLGEALEDGGLAGGVLVVTDDVEHSKVVREIEAPALLRLARDSAFSLAIANAVRTEDGKPDYAAPDRLLQMRPGTLASFMHHAVRDPAQMRALVSGVRTLRMKNLTEIVKNEGGVVRIDVQTRNEGSVDDRTGAGLDIRVRPAATGRLPDALGLRYFADAAGDLPGALTKAGATSVRFSGGAHLTVGLALGALVPSTRQTRMEVLDRDGVGWRSGPEHVTSGVADAVVHLAGVPVTGAGAVAAFVDLLPSRSDEAFARYIRERGSEFGEAVHVTSTGEEFVSPEAAGSVAAAVAGHLRELSNRNRNAELHLMYRGPFALAPLIGRLLNTITTVLYEWEPTSDGARYVPALRCVPSDQTRPVQVLLDV